MENRQEAIERYTELQQQRKRLERNWKENEAECMRLYREEQALTPHLIRANLENFNFDDLVVVGLLETRSGEEIGRREMRLSDLCGLRDGGLAKKLGVDPSRMDLRLRIPVEKDEERIGYVDSDGIFRFESAPDTRTALGWLVATDGGRVRVIEFFDLDKATDSIVATIREHGTGRDAFFGPYFDSLKKVCGRASRFGDGHCGAATTLWRVATRELGDEHKGYAFAY
jgi:hypothetical protein